MRLPTRLFTLLVTVASVVLVSAPPFAFSDPPTLLWDARHDGSGHVSDAAAALAVDDAGNVYVTGSSEGDYSTIKYDSDGNALWVATYSFVYLDYATAIAVDSSGNVIVTGYSYRNSTTYDFATLKYDSDGNELWVSRYNGPRNLNDSPSALAVDISGNIYVTGYGRFYGAKMDVITIKYDSNGNELWVKADDYGGSDDGRDIALDQVGNVFVTGKSHPQSPSDDPMIYTAKYDNDGNTIWYRHFNRSTNASCFEAGNDLEVDSLGRMHGRFLCRSSMSVLSSQL